MIEIDYKNLKIRNKSIKEKKEFILANITSDWSPTTDEISDLLDSETYKSLIGQ